ncbi:hypothetical protein LXA47_14120 [Massilia sp. P8910]|uniref:hypothetical protein n=1 Tax=Massilia antarctica TaxID=2765360 RepID=UPI0006BCDE59|nr:MULTISPECIES: hypothetical protein [Massilia]MCE3604736.1 hypothetical protein [Massilia antarctica]MCY0912185.1 hypothetical protein [Massilia sp. H27-R4]CUI06338.1 hypothetical protein BN2497_7453 [Janthinobacterium sp. CG23_2]CUU30124.1 hypothetical protein BN3177_7453 [Janthinobacterium sp. CG23_2]
MSSSAEAAPPRYGEIVGAQLLDVSHRLLTADEIDLLWSLVERIEQTWFLEHRANAIKPQWLDYLQTTVETSPSLLGEYLNAIAVYQELLASAPEQLSPLLLMRAAPPLSETSSRLDHAKRFVVDRFIRCYVMLGGFQEFGGRNYNGYMGGSRFADSAPVRVGRRL